MNLVLEDERVRLEPLDFRHTQDLFEAGNDEAVWQKSNRCNVMPDIEQTRHYIAKALYAAQNAGVPFAIVEKAAGKAIGSTRYFDISEADRKLEIGFTWIARKYWRTHVNTACKLLLLQYAFEQAQALRVQFKADSENDRSRRAIERIGATYEGTFRNFRIVSGSVRGVSYYSILSDEWPGVKAHLKIQARV